MTTKTETKRVRKFKPKNGNTELFIRNMPDGVKAHFKAWCAKRGLSMTRVLVALMHRTVTGKIEL